VSLRKCPDCGLDVSSAAAACPHCGRPIRRNASRIGLSGLLVIAVLCAGVLVWRLSSQYQETPQKARATAPETSIAQPSRTDEGLTATVGYNRKLSMFRVQNADSFAWTHCQLAINAAGVSSGYTHDVEEILPGSTDAALLASAEFVDGEGRRFEPATQQVTTLDVSCETPNGQRSYGGKF